RYRAISTAWPANHPHPGPPQCSPATFAVRQASRTATRPPAGPSITYFVLKVKVTPRRRRTRPALPAAKSVGRGGLLPVRATGPLRSPPFAEKVPQQLACLALGEPGIDLRRVMAGRLAEDARPVLDATAFGIGSTEI